MEAAVEQMVYPTYERYKDSGVEWLGEIPENWDLLPGAVVFEERNEKNIGLREKTVLSLSYGRVIVKPEEKLTGLVPESFETYQKVYPGDIIIRPTDLQNDKTSLRTGLSKEKGIITSAYINLRVKSKNHFGFFHYLLHTIDTNKMIYGLGSGLRQNLSFNDFKNFKFVVPSIREQSAIATFLDKKTAQIDQAIARKERQIELLKEHRQILIHRAVTRGLDPNVPMKDSGVEWIGQVPTHWEFQKLKFLFKEKRFKANPDLSCGSISFGKVVQKDDEKIPLSTKASYQELLTGEFLINPLNLNYDLISLRIALSEIDVVVSPGYIIIQNLTDIDKLYFKYLLHRYDVAYMKLLGSGVRQTISFNHIANSILVLPPKEEQSAIAAFIDKKTAQIDQAILNKQQEIEKLKELKASLINAAVTGKIKVKS
jgi:type I restriction enzyme S subunit